MSVQVPGSEVRIQESRVKQPDLKPLQERLARLEVDYLVVLLRECHRARDDTDPLAAKVGQGTNDS